MNDTPISESSFEAKVLSYLAVHATQIDGVTRDLKEMKEDLRRTNQIASYQSDKIHSIEVLMARKEGSDRSLIRRIIPLEKSVKALSEGMILVRGGYKAVAGIAGGMFLILTAAYHVLGIGKLLAAIVPKGN